MIQRFFGPILHPARLDTPVRGWCALVPMRIARAFPPIRMNDAQVKPYFGLEWARTYLAAVSSLKNRAALLYRMSRFCSGVR